MGGPYPVRVMSLDENFIVVRREANLALSHDLTGYHWYGAELCLLADILGWHAYVVEFYLLHKSSGNADAGFRSMRRAVGRKYARAFRPRWQYVVTDRPVFIAGSPLKFFLRALPLTWAWRKRDLLLTWPWRKRALLFPWVMGKVSRR